MKAVVLRGTCEAKDLQLSEIDIPNVKPGWVLVKVKAFGLNRSEVMLRSKEASETYIKLPIIPGIECAGVIVDPSDSDFAVGEKVIALMGGTGRSFHGSYTEYALLPEKNVFRLSSEQIKDHYNWIDIAAIPETYYTAWGSLVQSLQFNTGDVMLIRGATSACGLAALQLAKVKGCNVIATTRKEEKKRLLIEIGADEVLIEDQRLSSNIMLRFPMGVDKIMELIGPLTLKESLGLVKKGGIVCQTGLLGKIGYLTCFDPIKDIPNGVFLSSFFSNFPNQQEIDEMLHFIGEHRIKPMIAKVFPFDQIAEAHMLMESNQANGKIVIEV